MEKLAEHLLEKETITGKEFMEIYRREKGLPEPENEERHSDKKPEKQIPQNIETETQKNNAQTEESEEQPEESPSSQSQQGIFSNTIISDQDNQ